jgi:hypothetical protein
MCHRCDAVSFIFSDLDAGVKGHIPRGREFCSEFASHVFVELSDIRSESFHGFSPGVGCIPEFVGNKIELGLGCGGVVSRSGRGGGYRMGSRAL